MDSGRPGKQWLARLGWLLLIWAASVAALGLLSYGIKVFMRLAQLAP